MIDRQNRTIEAILNNELYQLKVFMKNLNIYFTHEEVQNYLSATYQPRDSAVISSITTLGRIYPGIGNVIVVDQLFLVLDL